MSDLSGLGAELTLFDAEETQVEAEIFYPGMIVASDGLMSGACDLTDNGDLCLIYNQEG